MRLLWAYEHDFVAISPFLSERIGTLCATRAGLSALAHGASLADTCRAAGWATPNTFARFYTLRVEPVFSRVLGNR